MATIAELLVKIGGDGSGLRKELQASQRQIKRSFGSEALEASGKAATAIGVFAAAIGAAGVASIGLAGKLRMTQKAFETLTGNAETAKDMIGDLKALDDKSSFSFDTYAKGAQKLLALGTAADQVIPTLTAIGDASAALGQGEEGIDRIVLALSQMTAKGKVSAQEMNQLAENNVQGWRYLSEATGKSVAEVQKMAENGMLNGAAAVKTIISGMERDFKGSMDKIADETPIVWNTIVSSAEQILAGIGPAIDEAFGINKTLIKVRDYLVEFKKSIDSIGIRDTLEKMVPPGASVAITALAGAITGAAIPALKLLQINAVQALRPLIPYIVVGAAVAAAIWLLWKPISSAVEYLGKFEIIAYTAKAALIALGGALAAISFQALIPAIVSASTVMVGFAASAWAAISPLLPFVAAAAAAAAIAFVIVKAWEPLSRLFKAVWDIAVSWTKQAWANILKIVDEKVLKLLKSIQPIADIFGGAVSSSVNSWVSKASDSLEEVKKASEQAKLEGKSAQEALTQAWKDTGKAVTSEANKIVKATKDIAATPKTSTTGTTSVSSDGLVQNSGSGNEAKELKKNAQIWDEVTDSANEYKKTVESIDLKGVNKQKFDIESNAAEKIDEMQRKYRDWATEYKTSTADQQKEFKKAWEANGIQFETTSDGMVDFTKQIAAEQVTIEKQKNKEIEDLHYARTKYQENLDKAYNDGNIKDYTTLLASQQALDEQDLKGRQQFLDAYYEAWKNTHQSAIATMTQVVMGMGDSIGTFFSDVLSGASSLKDAWEDLGENVAQVLANMIANFIAAEIEMVALKVVAEAFGITISNNNQKTDAAVQSQAAVTAAMVAGIAVQIAAAVVSTQTIAKVSESTAAEIAAAWAVAAAMVSLASYGANSVPAMVGIGATVALSTALAAVPALAKGGITTGPTLAEIGESKHYKEAVVPLSKKRLEKYGFGGSGGPTANVNQYNYGDINTKVDYDEIQTDLGNAVKFALMG